MRQINRLNRRGFLAGAAAASAALTSGQSAFAQAAGAKPNVVLIFIDDMGYGDLNCYGAEGFATPNLDRMAAEGARFTDFYTVCPACSPSRAALLTGSYHYRVGIPTVLGPDSPIGLNPSEVTIAEMLKDQGYNTACVGKWHIGNRPEWFPQAQGFDEWFGMPYSNDMWPYQWTDGANPAGEGKPKSKNQPDLPLYDNDRVVERNTNQNTLTERYTKRAIDFIERSVAADKPFFVYLPHAMVHVPIGATERFRGKTEYGAYGDTMEELDHWCGELLRALKRLNVDNNTLVLFTSDNGPWLPFGRHAGKTAGLREGKGTVFEGGVRMPFLARWPGKIPAGQVVEAPAATIDILPTVARVTGAKVPDDRVIDGKDIWPLLSGRPGAESPHEAIFLTYPGSKPQAVRAGKWKLVLPHTHRHQSGAPGTGGGRAGETRKQIELSLFDLEKDPNETTNVIDRHPEVAARLQRLHAAHLEDIRQNSRPPGRFDPSQPPKSGKTVEAGTDGVLRCLAEASIIHGKGAKFVPAPERRNIGHWSDLNTWVEWNVSVPRAGEYQVVCVQACEVGVQGASYEIRAVNGEKTTGVVQPTNGWADYVEVELGTLNLQAGRQTIEARGVKKPNRAIMNLREIRLVPAR